MKTLYLTSSSFSGSTLLAFLLNTHPEIVTVSEMIGWRYDEGETFECSCGNILEQCPFFQHIEKCFQENGLNFSYRNFGTAYQPVNNSRINRYLTESLPIMHFSWVEHLRDAVVHRLPTFSKSLIQSDRANKVFIKEALSYSKASVFLDATKSPFRMRHLQRIPDIELYPLYLVRDPHGVTLSTMKARGWGVAPAIKLWIRDQANIVRILDEFPNRLYVTYEELCDSLEETLARIQRYVGVEPKAVPQDFKSVEHHILGNTMRLQNNTEIRKNEKWKTKFSESEIATIDNHLADYVEKNKGSELSKIIVNYLNG